MRLEYHAAVLSRDFSAGLPGATLVEATDGLIISAGLAAVDTTGIRVFCGIVDGGPQDEKPISTQVLFGELLAFRRRWLMGQ